jgi:hypothetical protein
MFIQQRMEVVMKKLLILGVLAYLAVPVQATYYEITTGYTPGLSLQNSDTLLMTGGGIGILDLEVSSSATIEGTDPLEEGSGGIWDLNLVGDSHLDFSGGELRYLDISDNAIATLSGGSILSIESNQVAWQWDYGIDPPVQVPNPHITIIYSGDLPTVDASNILTGLWGDGSEFSIQLIDVQGYSQAIDNIQFVPEPASLLLLGLGGLMLRRKK